MLIQLPPEQLLPDAPAPVLDNQRRPTVDSGGILQGLSRLAGAGQEPLIPTEPFLAPGRGMEAIGQGIGDGAGFLHDVAMLELTTRRKRMELEAQSAASKKVADITNDLLLNHQGSPERWLSLWDEGMDGFVDTLITPETSPAAARNIRLDAQNIVNNGRIRLSTVSTQEEFRLLKANRSARINLAVDHGEMDLAKAEMQEGVRDGTHTAEDMSVLTTRVIPAAKKQKEREADALAYKVIQNDVIKNANTLPPDEVQRQIEALPVEPVDKEKLKDVARGVARDNQAQVSDEIANGIVTGAITSGYDIEDAYANNPFVTPEMLADAKARLLKFDALAAKAARNGPQGFQRFTSAYADALKWTPPADQARAAEEFGKKMANVRAYVPDDYQGEVTQILHQKFGANVTGQTKMRPEVQQQVSRSLAPQFGRMLDSYRATYEAKLSTWRADQSEANKKELEAAEKALTIKTHQMAADWARVEAQMKDFYQKHPDAKPDAIQAELTRIIGPGVAIGFMEALNGPDAAEQDKRQAEIDAENERQKPKNAADFRKKVKESPNTIDPNAGPSGEPPLPEAMPDRSHEVDYDTREDDKDPNRPVGGDNMFP